jgi:hypothetical protein
MINNLPDFTFLSDNTMLSDDGVGIQQQNDVIRYYRIFK